MVASVYRVKPREVFDRHRTENRVCDVLATGCPSTTFLVEPVERPLQADARLSGRGRSASGVQRLVGLPPLWECILLQDPVEVQSGQRAQESGKRREDRRSPRKNGRRSFQATRHMLHYLAR